MRLYELALQKGITIGPGYMFSATTGYSNFIRLNYSYTWSQEIEKALITIGKLAATLMR
jgi:DNA-binding transcriptional MocR family regulator